MVDNPPVLLEGAVGADVGDCTQVTLGSQVEHSPLTKQVDTGAAEGSDRSTHSAGGHLMS